MSRMPRYLLYHATNPMLLVAFYAASHAGAAWQQSVAQQHDPRHAPYRLVAEVEADSFEAIFDLTNHGVHQQDWRTNPGVHVCTTANVRSTSVGDVVVAPNGTPWICAPVGWRRITPDGSIYA